MRLLRNLDGEPPLADFTRFYSRHAEALVVFFARRVWDPDLAFELAAETFARAFAGRGRFRGTTDDAAAAWLYAIARNELARWHRRGRVRKAATRRLGLEIVGLADEEFARIEELADLAPVRAAVRAALGTLPAQQQEALELRVVAELPYDEVAARLKISEQATRARVSRGLQALARSMRANDPVEVA
jgi:RNA polymerase sigma factor (sigma-70 family)